jgi:hypothetical protein
MKCLPISVSMLRGEHRGCWVVVEFRYKWLDYDAEDAARFYGLLLTGAGITTPQVYFLNGSKLSAKAKSLFANRLWHTWANRRRRSE